MQSRWILSLSCSVFLVACQSVPQSTSLNQVATQIGSTAQTQAHLASLQAIQRQSTRPLLASYQTPMGKVTVTPAKTANKANIQVEITMPKAGQNAGQSRAQGFRTQALALNNITRVKAQIQGIGISSPIYALGADANGKLDNPGGTFSLTFNDVPYGAARWLELTSYDSSDEIIEGAWVYTGFHLSSATVSLELSWRTTLLGQILAIMNTHVGNEELSEIDEFPSTGSVASDHHLMSTLDLEALQSFLENEILGLSGTAPNYAYLHHPALIANMNLAKDLITYQGNLAELETINNTEPRYYLSPGTLTYTLSGLIDPDKATVVIRDPASGVVLGQGNGNGSISGIAPGVWKVEATAPGYVADTSPMADFTLNSSLDVGTIHFSVAETPVISGLSGSGLPGQNLTITGSNFHSTVAGNTVDFSGTIATVTSASATELVVTVPAGISGSQNVRVTVGGNTSNIQSFSVKPFVSQVNPTQGAVGSSIEILGHGFDPVAANNSVKLGNTPATVTAVTPSGVQRILTVTVPQAPSGDITVQVGSQTSNSRYFLVAPTVELASPANDAILHGTVTLGVNVTSGDTITKVTYYLDGEEMAESTSPPYSLDWDTTVVSSGVHSLQAEVSTEHFGIQSNIANITINQPPVISGLTASINPIIGLSHPTLLSCSVTDDLDAANISWMTIGGDFGTLDSFGAQAYWTSPDIPGGPYTIRCTADDGVNPPVSQDLGITVVSGTGNVTGNGGLF